MANERTVLMKIRITILTENDNPLPDVDIEVFEQLTKCMWQAIINRFLVPNPEAESATVEKVEVVREDGDGDG